MPLDDLTKTDFKMPIIEPQLDARNFLIVNDLIKSITSDENINAKFREAIRPIPHPDTDP